MTAASARIHLLSSRLANQIAAGEVVDRPASVIKELLENALDAGATRIEIDIDGGGSRRMCVRDNGDGIHPDDLALALTRHATSKIASIDDLAAVASLGFRGEALASIASVSRLTLTSRQRDADENAASTTTAWSAFADGADMQVRVQPAAAAVGTCVDVCDLFFNTPARRRFLRADSTEFAHIDDVVKRVALAQPQCAFVLRHSMKNIRQWRSESAAERMRSVMGKAFAEQAHGFAQQIDQVRVHGWIGALSDHRSSADAQYVYVNGRAIRDRVVSHALRAGYDQYLPPGRTPAYCVFIEMPATEVDVNVHPTKHEVRFRQARWMHDWLTQIVRQSVTPAADLVVATTENQAMAPASELAPSARLPANPSRPLFSANAPAPAGRVNEPWALYRDMNAESSRTESASASVLVTQSVHPAYGATPATSAEPAGSAKPTLSYAAGYFWWLTPSGIYLSPAEDLLLHWWRAELALASLKPLMFPQRLPLSERSAQICTALALSFDDSPSVRRVLAVPTLLGGCDWPVLFEHLQTHEDAPLLLAARHWLAQKGLQAATTLAAEPGAAWLAELNTFLWRQTPHPPCFKVVSAAAMQNMWASL